MKPFEQTLLDSYPEPYILLVFIDEQQGHVNYINEAAREVLQTDKSCIGQPIERIFPNPKTFTDSCRQAIEDGQPVILEHFSILPNDLMFESVRIMPLCPQSGADYCGVILDTPYKATKMMTDERMLQSIFLSSPNAVLIQNVDGEVYNVNPAFTEMFGWKDYEVIGNSVSLFPSGYEKEYEEIVRQLRQNDTYLVTNTKRVHKNGIIKDVSICYMNIYNHRRERTAVARLYIDISKQILFHEKYLEQRNSYQLITENMKDLVAIVDLSGKFVYTSPSHLDITGYPSESYLNMNVFRHIHPRDRRHVFKQIQQLIEAGRSAKAQIRYKHASKGYIWIELIASPLYENQAPYEKFVIVGRDITERKHSEEALRESEMKYRLILEKTSDFVVTFNQQGKVQFVSPSLQSWLKKATITNIYGFMNDHVVDEERGLLYEIIHHVFKTKKADQIAFTIDKDGHTYTFDAILTPLISNEYTTYSENMILLIARDITKRLEDEHISMQLEKMSTVGQLAAGIAHELRNPLTSVKGFVRMIKDEIDDSLLTSYLEIISGELDSIERIADEFMDLAKPHVISLEETELHEIIDSCVRLFEGTAFLQGINMDVEYINEQRIMLNCQRNALKRVFINIMKNAMEAMEKGGELNIKILARDPYVELLFIDSGKGIEKERLKYIGEPFYSTKEKGIGLGLMMSRKIVREHGGRLSIESEYNEGTTIRIILPLVSSKSTVTSHTH
ncbi:PAS domain S-box protein [Pseudalkalibacillus salsuginis]|uniref:PAS domain S-box protein n=1 Tax=Pseudalkalibacillus salsuginis TaxID=2910972 RepID=UPI001F172DD7|nr:PAS domain S-box protein [Pseudalkalibacillus salsuginis]MCF6409961.1 PAS domain S-box protein [Pseudalkalibacillus salsuginis]